MEDKYKIGFMIQEYFISVISFIVIIMFFGYLYYNNFSINEQAYFYTLSTISQTLAALIGFIGIFVVFRLQLLRSKNLDGIENLRTLINSDSVTMGKRPFYELDPNSSDDEMVAEAINIFEYRLKEAENEPDVIEFQRIVSEIRKTKSGLKNYKESIWFPIIIASFGMLIAIIALPFGRITLPNDILPIPLLPFIAVGLSLAFTVAGILAIIQSSVKLLMFEKF